MTPPNPNVKCRRCGKVNDNDRRHAKSGRRVKLCRDCDMGRADRFHELQAEYASSGYAKLLENRTCPQCHRVFIAKSVNGKFCTLECRNLNLSEWRKQQRTEMKRPFECQFCGATFVRRSGNGRYCSDECRLRVKRRDAWLNHLRGRYRLTQEAFDALRAAAGDKCEVCGSEFQQRGDIHVDHDHGCCPGSFTCGKCIRGLTCKNCNFMLGHAGDDPQRLQQGIDYLHRFDIEEPGG
jgi:endogenous inhibitor of DNA gyrase (YacG/DUF329 family)